MGLFSTRWEGSFEGHNITVSRSELTKGFSIEWDGKEIARRSWSWIGLGELHGTAEVGDKHHAVHAKLDWGDGIGSNGSCDVSVDGTPVAVSNVR